VLRVLEPALRMKAQTDSNRKILFVENLVGEKRRERLVSRGTWKPVILWARVGSGVL
jgi:hypothetical protein